MTIHHNTRRTLSQKTKIKCLRGRCRAKRANKTRRLVLKTIMLDVVPFDRARENYFFNNARCPFAIAGPTALKNQLARSYQGGKRSLQRSALVVNVSRDKEEKK